MLIAVLFTACDKQKAKEVEKAELNVENLISTDRQDMFMNYAQDYFWYETCVTLKEYLDSDETTDEIVGTTSIFQILEDKSTSIDTRVVMITHTAEETVVEVKQGFWVDDLVLNQEAICITFAEAYEKMMEANYPKPHSRQCVIRKPLGPKECNPQYIFGNIRAQLYVDAVTGEVNYKNPAFNE